MFTLLESPFHYFNSEQYYIHNIQVKYCKNIVDCAVRASIEQTSQHPESLQYISNLEDYSRYQRTESVEETHAQKPAFIRPLHNLGELAEGRNAHFEGQLSPVSDPTMKVEWYKDGRSITASESVLIVILLNSENWT